MEELHEILSRRICKYRSNAKLPSLDTIFDLMDMGISKRKIARHYGVSPQRVSQVTLAQKRKAKKNRRMKDKG